MKRITALKTILLDMDGVLWRGSQPVVDIPQLFERVQGSGKQFFCVTNNSTRSVRHHLEKLRDFGVSLTANNIITSAEASAAYLAEKYPQRGDVFMIGESGLHEALKEKGFHILEDPNGKKALAVVVGLDKKMTYRDFDLAIRYIREGSFFVGTNPDLTIPTPTGPAPGAGAILRGLEVSSGIEPYIIGKPYSALFDLALARANSLPEETLMIGDRLETDILGAQRAGMLTAVVFTGIASAEQAASWHPEPDIAAETALQVLDILDS